MPLHGRQSFGARQYASNFDREELTRAVYFAHMHRVRLYITVNTLVDDAEIGRNCRLPAVFKQRGVDGIIVQDMGVINLARKLVAAAAAACQHADDGFQFGRCKVLESLGFKRVVYRVNCHLRKSGILFLPAVSRLKCLFMVRSASAIPDSA